VCAITSSANSTDPFHSSANQINSSEAPIYHLLDSSYQVLQQVPCTMPPQSDMSSQVPYDAAML